MATNREIVERYAAALPGSSTESLDVIRELRHPDFVEDWPQSGERIRGDANMRAIDEARPNPPREGASVRFVGGEDRWVLTPQFTTLRIEGTGDIYTTVAWAVYPPETERWWVTSIVELRDHLVYRATTFFARSFDPPEWRAAWVERIPDSAR